MSTKPDPVLCYVNGAFAYFTTQPLEKQWGDDWNDAPYEHNAGAPYEWYVGRPNPKYEIAKVAWEGPFELPCCGCCNSPYSVEDINNGAVAWLRLSPYTKQGNHIPAGTPLSKFIELVKEAGGTVYLPAPAATRKEGR